jgi:HK97 family phage prohead protease
VLGADQDTYALFNHDPNLILGRTLAGTLRVAKDTLGLPYEADVPSSRADVAEHVQLGNITGSSFSFRTAADGDAWSLTEDGFPLRTVTSIARLYDVGPVTYPAYLQTHEAGDGAAMRSLSARVGRHADELVEASRAGRLHELVAKELREGTPEKPAGLSPELILARIDAERRRVRSLGH